MSDKPTKEKKSKNFDERGKFLPGNQIGKIKKKKAYDIDELKKAIEMVEKDKDTTFLEYFINEAWTKTPVLIALVKKLVPDISISELKGSANPFNLFVTQFLGSGLPPDLPKDLPKDIREKYESIQRQIEDYKKEQALKKQGG